MEPDSNGAARPLGGLWEWARAAIAAVCAVGAAALGLARGLLVDLLVISGIVLVVLIVIREARRPDVVIEEISLPDKLKELGYSGHVASMRLIDAVNQLTSETLRRTDLDKKTVLTAVSQQFDLVEPQSGLSLRTISNAIDAVFPARKRRVAGEFVCTDAQCSIPNMQLRMRVSTGGDVAIASAGRIGDVSEAGVEAYFRKSAVELLKLLDPIVIAERLAAARLGEAEFGSPEGVRLEAIRISRALTRNGHGDDARAAALLGGMYAEMGDGRAAAYWFAEVERRAGPRERALIGTSLYLWSTMAMGRDDAERSAKLLRAKQIFAEEAAAGRLDPSYFAWRAYTLEALDDDDGAEAVYAEWVTRRPEDAHAHLFFGLLLARQARRDGAGADMESPIMRIEEALALDPYSHHAHNEIGNLLVETDRPSEAIGRYADAVRSMPDEPVLHRNLAYAVFLASERGGDETCALVSAEEREGLPDAATRGFRRFSQACAEP